MNRREFMRTAGGATAVASATTAAATVPSAAQEDGGTETPSGDGGNETATDSDGGGGTETVTVGPGGDLVFDPEELTIQPGTTVVWEWDSDGHNVMPDSIPDDADWEGHESIEGSGFTYEHTFEVEGTYEYVCVPHEQAGMVGTIEVTSDAGSGGGGGGGGTEEVTVGPGGELVFDPAELTIQPGTTVHWVWDSDTHNIVPESQPDGAEWDGTEGGESQVYDAGHEYEFTFEVEGTYEYYCAPHRSAGMVGSVEVTTDTGGGGGGEGGGEVDPEHMGVPIQAHFVGLATILAILISLVFTFFVLKYGESPHASGGNR